MYLLEWPNILKNNTKCWQGCRMAGILMYCSYECKMVQGPENSLADSYKQTLPYNPLLCMWKHCPHKDLYMNVCNYLIPHY